MLTLRVKYIIEENDPYHIYLVDFGIMFSL